MNFNKLLLKFSEESNNWKIKNSKYPVQQKNGFPKTSHYFGKHY